MPATPRVIEFTWMMYVPTVNVSVKGPALKTPCAEIVENFDTLAALFELVAEIDQAVDVPELQPDEG